MSVCTNTIINQLKAGNKNFVKLLASYNSNDWLVKARFNKYNYTPTVIYKDDQVSLKIVTWLRGQNSGIHTHKDLCCYRIIKGELIEYLYEPLNCDMVDVKTRKESEICGANNKYYHMMKNVGSEYAVSLHIYYCNKENHNDCFGDTDCDDINGNE